MLLLHQETTETILSNTNVSELSLEYRPTAALASLEKQVLTHHTCVDAKVALRDADV
jgi:hypothetical protein